MKAIKCWVAQDYDEDSYLFRKMPKNIGNLYHNWQGNKESAKLLGQNLLMNEELKSQPVKCVIITQEEYDKLNMKDDN